MAMILLRALVAYAIAHLLVNERGPYRLLERIRELAGILPSDTATGEQLNRYIAMTDTPPEEIPKYVATTEVGLMLLCMYCTGIWTNIIAVLLTARSFSLYTVAEFFAAYGVYTFMLNLVEVLDGLESFLEKVKSIRSR